MAAVEEGEVIPDAGEGPREIDRSDEFLTLRSRDGVLWKAYRRQCKTRVRCR